MGLHPAIKEVDNLYSAWFWRGVLFGTSCGFVVTSFIWWVCV
jgi:hypothetical protein